VSRPVVFRACTADEGTKFLVNPFGRVNLGYDGSLEPRAMFFHLEVQTLKGAVVEELDVPVLNTAAAGSARVESGTILVDSLGCCGGFGPQSRPKLVD
jgi:hypothetical protein